MSRCGFCALEFTKGERKYPLINFDMHWTFHGRCKTTVKRCLKRARVAVQDMWDREKSAGL